MNRPSKRSVSGPSKKTITVPAEDNKDDKDKKENPPGPPTTQVKKTVAYICCLRLRSTWTIRTQFLSSIFILNLIFLAIIIACIAVIISKFVHFLIFFSGSFDWSCIFTLQFDSRKNSNGSIRQFPSLVCVKFFHLFHPITTQHREQSEAIANKLSYYYTVNDYFGRLLQGMALQDKTLFKYTDYPYNQPDSTTFTDLPSWGYTVNSKVTSDTATYYKNISLAINYFARSLLTNHEDIPILSMYASYVNSDKSAIMTFGYPSCIILEL